MNRAYLDNASATPVKKEVLDAIPPMFTTSVQK
jgi:cysteine sulfinate desulfinase/cysteine desulfurase-like protein